MNRIKCAFCILIVIFLPTSVQASLSTAKKINKLTHLVERLDSIINEHE